MTLEMLALQPSYQNNSQDFLADFSAACLKEFGEENCLKWFSGLEIASQFHTVFLSNVPMMPPRLASEARRFTWLIDVLYDRRVKLILSAEVMPEALYTEGPLAHEFPRTISRLHEMQSSEFLALEHRTVDTHIT